MYKTRARYRRACVLPIRIYQRTLSPDHSFWAKWFYPEGYCRFMPTCSEYTCRAILDRGLVKGGLQGLWRICRCNPWSEGGIDNPGGAAS